MSSAKKKSRKSSSSRPHGTPVDEWKRFTSPDGHVYFHNAALNESRWELPVANEAEPRRLKGGKQTFALNREKVEQARLVEREESRDQGHVSKDEKNCLQGNKGVAKETDTSTASKPKNAMFQKLQASLEGRLQGPMMGRLQPPPMLDNRQKEGVESVPAMTTQFSDKQYEAETAGMGAAERLRFLRKKRQESISSKREGVAADDFVTEVANNLKKKGVVVKPHEKQRTGSVKGLDWKLQEESEVQHKREDMEKERAKKDQKEIEQQREQERARQRELEHQHELERQERRKKQEKKAKKKKDSTKGDDAACGTDFNNKADGPNADASSTADLSTVPVENNLDVSSPDRRAHRRRRRSNSDRSTQFAGQSQSESVENAVNGEYTAASEVAIVKEEEKREREEVRACTERETEVAAVKQHTEMASDSSRRKSVSSSKLRTRSTSGSEAEKDARAKEKQIRRERRRMAKMKAMLAAQSLESEEPHHERAQQNIDNSATSPAGPGHAGWYASNGQPLPGQPVQGQPSLNGGVFPQYPYVLMPPYVPSPYGYYAMPIPMYAYGIVPSAHQPVTPTPPPSTDGVVALVPHEADYGNRFGQQPFPALSRCKCCKGVGVGLVEKNDVCAHCNRLRLAFIVDSAQMRQRCSVCGGWGFKLLHAKGMCLHCTRQTAQKAQARLVSKAANSSCRVGPSRAAASRSSVIINASKNDELDGIDWDNSSSDDSDWDE